MFPEIVRDEVFRLETRRLWLRWPTLSDAFDADHPGPMPSVDFQPSLPDQGGTRAFGSAGIAAWRAENERGAALSLMLESKAERMPVGTVRLCATADSAAELDYYLLPSRRGQGLMTEAVQAVVHSAFLTGMAGEITASPMAGDRSGRGVLERCGFTYVGSGMRSRRTGHGLTACDHFRLDRRTWLSLQGWGMPGLGTKLQFDPVLPDEVDPAPCP